MGAEPKPLVQYRKKYRMKKLLLSKAPLPAKYAGEPKPETKAPGYRDAKSYD